MLVSTSRKGCFDSHAHSVQGLAQKVMTAKQCAPGTMRCPALKVNNPRPATKHQAFSIGAGYSPKDISYNAYAEADGITCSADIFYEGQVQTTCKHVLVLIHLMSVRTANTISRRVAMNAGHLCSHPFLGCLSLPDTTSKIEFAE